MTDQCRASGERRADLPPPPTEECHRCFGCRCRRGGARAGRPQPPSPSRPPSPCSSPAGPRPPPPGHARRRAHSRSSPGPRLDPALVAGRGADVDFVEQEAENAAHQRRRSSAPTASAYTLPAEASGRRAVKLTPGQYVEFTLPSAANAITVRYSIPDAPTGGGITAPLRRHGQRRAPAHHDADLAVRVALQPVPVLQRPATPGLLHPDWWITECACVPAATTPTPTHHQAVPAQPLLRRAAAAARPHLPGRRQGPAHRAGRQRRRLDRHRPARLRAGRRRRTSTCSRRTCWPSGPTRPAGATRPTRSTRPSPSPSAATSRSTSRRAPTRSTGTSSSTT